MPPTPRNAVEVLSLSGAEVLARGHNRTCYRHPQDESKCIKIGIPERASPQNQIESDYFEHLRKRKVPLHHIAACHGWVETDHGPGLVFDRVFFRGASQEPSLNLSEAIRLRRLEKDAVRSALQDLRRYLKTYNILWSDENPDNLCATLQPSLRLMIVDGLGARKWNSPKYAILKALPWVARLYTSNKVDHLFDRVEALWAASAEGGRAAPPRP